MSRLPDMIVIGAQKCGTTTLWEDLRGHPSVHLGEKESRVLSGGPLDRAELVSRYARQFKGAKEDAVLGEVSTRYAMLPDDPDAPANARTVAPNARIVYIVRDPLDRVISHHHHDFGLGFVGPNIDEAVGSYPSLLDNTRYATQVSPWLEAFGPDAVRVVKFEEYVADRVAGCSALLQMVGIDMPYDPGDEVHNAADTKHIASGQWSRITRSPVYRRVRPLLGEALRRRLGRAVLPQAPARPPGPSDATIDRLVAELAPEVDRLSELTGRPPLWDLSASAARLRGAGR